MLRNDQEADLSKLTLSTLHQYARQDYKLEEILAKFGVCKEKFLIYISYFEYQAKPLKFAQLKIITIDNAKNLWSDYATPFSALQARSYAQMSIKELHAKILAAKGIQQAAASLGTYRFPLINFLAKIQYQDQALDFKKFKQLSVEQAQAYWGEEYCNLPKLTTSKKLRAYSWNELYKVIITSKNIDQCARKLGQYCRSLSDFLDRHYYLGSSLSFDRIKNMSSTEAKQFLLHMVNNQNPQALTTDSIVVDDAQVLLKKPSAALQDNTAQKRARPEKDIMDAPVAKRAKTINDNLTTTINVELADDTPVKESNLSEYENYLIEQAIDNNNISRQFTIADSPFYLFKPSQPEYSLLDKESDVSLFKSL